jgi:aspartate aminotransferase
MTAAAPPSIKLAARMGRFKPSASQAAAQQARDLAAAGRDIISLTAGEPDFPTPDHVKAAATAAMGREETKYTNRDGSPEMKAAVIEKFRRENGLVYQSDQIIASTGAKQVIFNALMATVDTGDEVIVPAPHWLSYPDMVRLVGGDAVIVPCPGAQQFKLQPDDLEAAITPATRWLIFNAPGNPAGAVYSAGEIAALAAVLLRHPHVGIISDDIYEHLRYDGQPFITLAQHSEGLYNRTLCVNGVSKAYAMTGWRLGYGAGPANLIKAMANVQGQSTACPSSIGQAAAIAALTGDQGLLAERAGIMQARRDLICRLLNDCPGLSCLPPGGAMYIFVSCAGLIGAQKPDGGRIESDGDFTAYLLDAAGIAVVTGAAYGLSPYIRISFAMPEADLTAAAARIHTACENLEV